LIVLMVDFWTGLQTSTFGSPRSAVRLVGDAGYSLLTSACYTLLAMVPLGLGMAQMFGILGLLDIPLNPANMIVLPLILGIGIDDGVHVVHDFRRQRGRYRISASTASAVLITSLTTMVGFGSLMIASHRGLQSLGRVLTIGVSCCLFTSLVMLPAILILATRRRREDNVGVSEDAEIAEVRPVAAERSYRVDAAHHPGSGMRASTGGTRKSTPTPARGQEDYAEFGRSEWEP